ncbi:hypothetical protein RhiirA1_477137 [Rhizophagus irregularis]|uniref:Uncharacterized protein n=1 Tax=Rhizophagus irregularis TaxID=588596 RepID=A0A2N0QTZ0_9GLOM|nr:hypothetical protein RhiirA1_477137 [Rhizophagus irregularis]GET54249.1 hypothetical protein RIR_e15830_A0A2N0QTZ0_9GLOM [Rhizophagus irregularis DAOM 181602=DAOM 197198]
MISGNEHDKNTIDSNTNTINSNTNEAPFGNIQDFKCPILSALLFCMPGFGKRV